MHKLREENKWLQNFSSDFLQLFSVILLESARWILPLKAFWISPVEKRHPLLTLEQKKVSSGGKGLFVPYSWILPGTVGCKASLELPGRSPRPWLGGRRAGLRGIQQSACWQSRSSCQLPPEHKQKGTSCSLQNHRIFLQISSDVTATAK